MALGAADIGLSHDRTTTIPPLPGSISWRDCERLLTQVIHRRVKLVDYRKALGFRLIWGPAPERGRPLSADASLGDPSLAKAFLARRWIDPDARARRLFHWRNAVALNTESKGPPHDRTKKPRSGGRGAGPHVSTFQSALVAGPVVDTFTTSA
jgi:hypothetical protein